MHENKRCQSCGMPLTDESANAASAAEADPVSEYCSFCFRDGDFTNPDQTLDEMIRSSVDYMTANMGFTREKATELSNAVIPKLKRWQKLPE